MWVVGWGGAGRVGVGETTGCVGGDGWVGGWKRGGDVGEWVVECGQVDAWVGCMGGRGGLK